MKALYLVAFFILTQILFLPIAHAQQQEPLGERSTVVGELEYLKERHSVADHFYDTIMRNRGGNFATFDLDAKYTRLVGWVGVDDHNQTDRDLTYSIALDGRVAVSGRISGGESAVPINLDVTGVRAVRVTLDYHVVFADAVLIRPEPPTPVIEQPASPPLTQDEVVVTMRGESIKVTVNGQPVNFSHEPRQVSGRILVPLRELFEALGASVQYNARGRTIRAKRGETRVLMVIGQRAAVVGGQFIQMDVPAQAIFGRVMVPLRFVSQSLGVVVRVNN